MSPVASSTTTVAPSPAGMSPAARPGKSPYRHIDDLTSVAVDLDPHTPLRKVLEAADAHMRQATTFNDFRRPDLALQEYIKAFTIAVDAVPKHKDYPSLKSDRGELSRRYGALQNQIMSSGPLFAKIKEDIKADNARSGIAPTKPADGSSKAGLISRGETQARGADRNGISSQLPKSKPFVHPKPHSLAGKPMGLVSGSSPHDLATRFAKLREPQELPIRQTATEDRGPEVSRERSVDRPRPSVDSSVPILPSVPKAVYSPARGTVTSEIADLPSSTPRGLFSRTNSFASVPSGSARTSIDSGVRPFPREQYVTAHTFGEPTPSQATKVPISNSSTISVRDLYHYMNLGSKQVRMLLIDVRDRQSFDDGHIMSQSTICVEPEILSRQNVSADDIVDSMVLAPPEEKLAMEQRDKVDLVVLYDQDSTSVPTSVTADDTQMVLYNAWQALVHFNFGRPLRNGPKLLVGGVDAWIDDFGPQSLATGQTGLTTGLNSGVATSRFTHTRRTRNKARTLPKEELEKMNKLIEEDRALAASSSTDYVRTKEEFYRRVPAVSRAPESMVTPNKRPFASRHLSESDEMELLRDIAPRPPSRPKPSVARTKYSGLKSTEEGPTLNGMAMASQAGPAGVQNARRKRTGLYNPGFWCYANAALQVLNYSPGFIDEMLDPNWPINQRPNVSQNAPSYPQLMSKILGNLFQWMHKGQFSSMRATTLMHYLRSIHQGYSPANSGMIYLGDNNQHDTQEFMIVVFDQLRAETKQVRDRPADLPPVDPGGHETNVDFFRWHWWNLIATGNNAIDRHFTYAAAYQGYCASCKAPANAFDVNNIILMRIAEGGPGTGDLVRDLRKVYHYEEAYEADCGKCHHPRREVRNTRFARLPPLLCFQLDRAGQETKYTGDYTFPIDKPLDLKEFMIDENERKAIRARIEADGGLSDGFSGETRYELYGLVLHQGENKNQGHYISYVKLSATQWTTFNDINVTVDPNQGSLKARMTSPGKGDPFTPTHLFYRRVDVKPIWERNLQT
ncbi:hypothetical protein F4780DRAFT_5964 [Xylariomycetidae sp. FL0641]|nr:hypothetical protein F4780DRAFT_5964 [Xylariomycetidae sp. FL0641]